jgi:cation diffusion facilitator CzcD-associated flavoprotein CzcO
MDEIEKSQQALESDYDVIVIGGGQAALSVGFYLRRTDLSYVILDAQKEAGGAWLRGWNSLRLFSPAQWSSLPGWLFPGNPARYPARDEVIDYLRQYEERYKLPVARPVKVNAVRRDNEKFIVETDTGKLIGARAIVSATGTWQKPFIPFYPGREKFQGRQIHSAYYTAPEQFAGQNVLVIGAGNSGAQIIAEVSLFADAVWVTLEEPMFLPDDVDGRVLFDRASEQYRALTQGNGAGKPKSNDLLGHIVMVEPVREARNRDALKSRRPFVRFTENGVEWEDGSETIVDTVIWCTGFRPSLDHLKPLGVVTENGRVETAGTRSVKESGLWLVGYGNWTGFASATLIGVGRSARATVEEISVYLKNEHS